MKPTLDQQQFIHKHLSSLLKYKDTYDEVYDHVLTALELLPNDERFFSTVDNILETELGGTQGIKLIERKYRRIAIKQFVKDYFNIVANCLTSALTPIIIAGTVGFYLLVRNIFFNYFNLIEMFVCFIPSIVQFTLIAKRRVLNKGIIKITPDYMADARECVRVRNMWVWGMVMIFLNILAQTIYDMFGSEHNWKTDFGVYPLVVLFFVVVIHSIVYYKLFTDMPNVEF
jgi:hypothetical protein